MSDPATLTLHASAVCANDTGLLIRGAAGSGKSGLALQMIALGATLVADDRVIVTRTQNRLLLSCPDSIRGLIEARGVGLLKAYPVDTAPLSAVVDLDRIETDRLPPWREAEFLGLPVPLFHNCASTSFPAALMQYLTGGRHA